MMLKRRLKIFSILLALLLTSFWVLDSNSYAKEVEYVSIEEYIDCMTKLYSDYGFEYYYINRSGTERIEADYLAKRLIEDEIALKNMRNTELNIENNMSADADALPDCGVMAFAPYDKTFNVQSEIKGNNFLNQYAQIMVSVNLTLNAQYEDIISVNSITSRAEGSYRNLKSYTHASSSYRQISDYELEVTVTGWTVFEWQVESGSGTNTEGYQGYLSDTVTVKTK